MSKPQPDRPHPGWAPPIWTLLSPEQRAALRHRFGLPRDWRPPHEPEPPLVERRLEGLDELARIMKWPPGRLGQLKQSLIDRVEPEAGE